MSSAGFRAALALSAAFGWGGFAGPASAQVQPCPAGTTVSGACANPILVQQLSQRAQVFSQTRISFLGYPLFGRTNGYIDAVRDRDTPQIGVNRPIPVAGPPTGAPTAPLSPGTFVGLPAGVDPARLQIGAPYTVVPGGIRIR